MKQLKGSVKSSFITTQAETKNPLFLNSERKEPFNNARALKESQVFFKSAKKDSSCLSFNGIKPKTEKATCLFYGHSKNEKSIDTNSGSTKEPGKLNSESEDLVFDESKKANPIPSFVLSNNSFKGELKQPDHKKRPSKDSSSLNKLSNPNNASNTIAENVNMLLDSIINNSNAINCSTTSFIFGNKNPVTRFNESLAISNQKDKGKDNFIPSTAKKINTGYSEKSLDEDEHSCGILKNNINKFFDQESEFLNLKLGEIESELNKEDEENLISLTTLNPRYNPKRVEESVSLQEAEISITEDMNELSSKKMLQFKIKKARPSKLEILIARKIQVSQDFDNSRSMTLANESNYTKNLQEVIKS